MNLPEEDYQLDTEQSNELSYEWTRKPRASAEEAEKRKRIVAELVLQGKSLGQIQEFVREKTDWDINDNTVKDYLKAAKKIVQEETDDDRDLNIKKAIARFESLFEKAVEAGHLDTARKVQDSLNKLLGLNAPTKIERQDSMTLWLRAIDTSKETNIPLSHIEVEQLEDGNTIEGEYID